MKVVARLKPVEDPSIVSILDSCLVLDPPPSETVHNKRARQHKFILDNILLTQCTQQQVYEATTEPLLNALMEGHNATIFAYGATGCGKTHTVTGTPNDPGIIFRAMQHLFQYLNSSETVTELSLSYLEIYNEQIRDLLQPETPSSKLNLLEANDGIRVANLTKLTPLSLDHIYDIIVQANKNRTVSPTQANATSSRSHAILQINLLQSTNSGLEDTIIQSTLNIIDLAGSERASSTYNKGKTLHEGANINKSLLALGSCINALSDSKPHIPYRNSKLTRLLKYSLGGNCETCMIVCIAPDMIHFDDSLNALKYAHMAKNIKNSSVVNKDVVKKHIGSYEKTITEQQRIIEKLQSDQREIINEAYLGFQSQLHSIESQIHNFIDTIEQSIISSNLDQNYLQMKIETSKVLFQNGQLMDFLDCLTKYDIESRFSPLKSSISETILSNEVRLDQLKDQVQTSELELFIDSTARSHLNQLQRLQGWCDLTSDLYISKVSILKNKYLNEISNDSIQSSPAIDPLIRLLTQLESLLDTPASNLKMESYGLIDSITNQCIQLLSPAPIINEEIVRKRRQEDTHELQYTPRKSSRISSLNIQMGDINIDTTDDSIDASPLQQQRIQVSPKLSTRGLTTRKLIASPKIHSPNRLAGLGVSYQVKFKGFNDDNEGVFENGNVNDNDTIIND